MTTADSMKGLERFMNTLDTFVHEQDGHNVFLAVTLCESRETEHRLRAFVLLKVSLNCVSNHLLIRNKYLTEFFHDKCSASRQGVALLSGMSS